jgi:hypothetical protein
MEDGSPQHPAGARADRHGRSRQRLRDESRAGAWIYPSRLRFKDGKMYLLRVVVAEEHMPPVIVTAYRTSKIEKYWSAE